MLDISAIGFGAMPLSIQGRPPHTASTMTTSATTSD
jgi:hypothetical protein